MAKQTINQGTAPFGDGGENIRVGTAKLQANDDELYAFLGAGADGILNQAAARAAIGLGSVDNTSDVNKPISTATQNALNQKANTVDVNNALAGKADLVGGFIPASQIPAIAITEFLGNVTTEAAMLALVGQKGDWCIRTDMGKAYIITGASSSLITDWTEWVYPVSPVTSVNGQVGVVTLNYTNVGADAAGSAATVQSNLDTHAGNSLNPHGVTKEQVGLGNVDNTSDLNKPISAATQTALNAKANNTDVNTALSLKADLVDGKVPAGQVPILDSSGKKILMDFTSAVRLDRGALQTTVLNGNTVPFVLPNGTATVAGVTAFNASNPDQAGFLSFGISDSEAYIDCSRTGTAAYKNLNIKAFGRTAVSIQSSRVVVDNGAFNKLYISTDVGPDYTWQNKELIIESRNGGNPGISFHALSNTSAGILKWYGPSSRFELRDSVETKYMPILASAFTVNSDYRLKDITGPVTNSGQFIDSLKPKQGTWKADGSKFVGFIAHEVQNVSPSSVVGVKDAEEDDGKPIYQCMDYSSSEIIANMVAELQALRLRVAELEAKVV